jgi:hypothetical protein
MRKRVKIFRPGQVLILAAAFMMTLATAFAQETGNTAPGSAPADINENIDSGMPRMNAAEAKAEEKQMVLLNELLQPDSAIQGERTGTEEPCGSKECTIPATR